MRISETWLFQQAASSGAYGGACFLSVAESVPPSVAITSPTSGANVMGADFITISADAFDPDGTVARVDFFVDYQLVASLTNAPYSFEYVLSNKVLVGQRVWARATDDRGLATISSSISFVAYPPPPANDNFAKSISLSGFLAMSRGSIAGVTWEPGESASVANPNGGSAWWVWTAPACGKAILTAQGYNSALKVFTGSTVSNLNLVASSAFMTSDSPSQVRFAAEAGLTYHLAAERNGPNAANLTLSLLLEAPPFSGLERLVNGSFGLHFVATPGPDWIVQASTDLAHWTSIHTNSEPSGSYDFIDAEATNFPQRFYRIVSGN
jgi:hypothetical protein